MRRIANVPELRHRSPHRLTSATAQWSELPLAQLWFTSVGILSFVAIAYFLTTQSGLVQLIGASIAIHACGLSEGSC